MTKKTESQFENGAEYVPLDTPSLSGYTIEGLMNDFPTARDLEQFVYTQTDGAISLNLKGRSNQLKYQLALDALEGVTIDREYLTDDNPYMEKSDLVPQDELRPVPARHPDCPPRSEVATNFNTHRLPHPDAQAAAQNQTCSAQFRYYRDGTVTYEILGPVNKRPEGQRLNKFGHLQPARIKWVDPRTGEQVLMYPNGQFTPVGKVLHERLKKLDGMDVWSRYITRPLSTTNRAALANPWGGV